MFPRHAIWLVAGSYALEQAGCGNDPGAGGGSGGLTLGGATSLRGGSSAIASGGAAQSGGRSAGGISGANSDGGLGGSFDASEGGSDEVSVGGSAYTASGGLVGLGGTTSSAGGSAEGGDTATAGAPDGENAGAAGEPAWTYRDDPRVTWLGPCTPIDLSEDGNTALAREGVWNAETGWTALPDLPGGTVSNTPVVLSGDGRVVFGVSNSELGWQVYRWTRDAGISALNALAQQQAYPMGTTTHGGELVFCASTGELLRWDTTEGLQPVRSDSCTCAGAALSSNGLTLIEQCPSEPWIQSAVSVQFSTLNAGCDATELTLSGDGSTVAKQGCLGGGDLSQSLFFDEDPSRTFVPPASVARSWSPAFVPELEDVVQIANGSDHGCAVLADSTVRCWGENGSGQLGDGTLDASALPVLVADLTGVVQVAAGKGRSCALLQDGSVRCWGRRIASSEPVPRPFVIEGITHATQLSLNPGGERLYVLLDDHSMQALGDSSTTFGTTTPLPITSAKQIRQVLAQDQEEAFEALTLDGDVLWGLSTDFGYPLGPTFPTTPIQIAGTDPDVLNMLENFTCALLADGHVKCVAPGDYLPHSGELGTHWGTLDAIPGIDDAVEITAGAAHVCVLHASGGVSCWGHDNVGQLGIGFVYTNPPYGLTQPTAVAEFR